MKRMLIFCLVVGLAVALLPVGRTDATTFTFEQVGSTVYNPGNEYPYKFDFELNISTLDPADAPVTDFEIFWPVKHGGYIHVTAPEGWHLKDVGLYGIGYEANTSDEYVNEAGSLGGFSIEGKFPELVGGSASLTKFGDQVGPTTDVMLPMVPEPATLCLLGLGGLLLRRKKKCCVKSQKGLF